METKYKIGVEITGDDSKFRATTKSSEKAIADLGKYAKNSGAAMASFTGNVAADAVVGMTSLFKQGGAAVLDYSAKLEQSKIGFETLMGSSVSAEAHLKDLQRFAAETPFEFVGLVKSSQLLQGVGIEGARVIPILTDVGNALAAAGKSNEEVDRTVLALSQIHAKGKLAGQEIIQLAENGIPALKILSQETGRTSAEIIKMSEEGQISSEMFLKAFQSYSKANFGDAMEKQSKTFSGAMSNISDSVMITAATAFDPLFEKVSGLSVDLSKEVQAQGDDLGAVGEVIGRYIVSGATAAVAMGGEAIVSGLVKNIKSQFSDNPETLFFAKGTEILVEGIGKGLGYEWDILGRNIKAKVNPELAKTAETAKSINKNAKETQSLAKALEVKKAADETKKLSGEITEIARDLSIDILFFGDQTEVAAVKQQLLTKGVADFNSEQAKSVINIAQNLDKLKKQAEAQGDYNKKLKDAEEHLKDLRETAEFDLKFANPTDLDRFEDWVTKNALGFRTLKGEIIATRTSLQKLAFERGILERNDLSKSFADGIINSIDDLDPSRLKNLSKFRQSVIDAVKPLKLEKADLGAMSAEDFAKTLENKISAYYSETEKAKKLADGVVGDPGLIQEELKKRLVQIEDKYYGDIQLFLSNLKKATVFPNGEKGFVQIFADAFDFQNVGNFIKLWNASQVSINTEGLERLDGVISDLGITVKEFVVETDLEKLEKAFSDPAVTEAIEYRAKALVMTADALKGLMRNAVSDKAIGGEIDYDGQGARYVDQSLLAKKEKGHGEVFSDGFFGATGIGKIQSEAEIIKGVVTDLGTTTGEVFGDMSNAVGSAIEGWLLYGDSVGESLQKATASILANLAAQATVKAIYQTAEGFAALFFNPAQAAAHFKSAALYGAVALGAGVGAKAVAGDAFKKDGKSGSTNSSQNPSEYFQNDNQSVNYLRESQNGLLAYQQSNLRLEEQIGVLSGSVDKLENRIGSVTPGDMLTNGIKQRSGLIAETVNKEIGKNSTTAGAMGRRLGLK